MGVAIKYRQDTRDGQYKRNLRNIPLTVLLTVSFMTILYCLIWFPKLNKNKTDISSDTMVNTFTTSFQGIN